MKTFRQYITEKEVPSEEQFEEMADKILEDCQPFLKEINYPKSTPLWRAITNETSDFVTKPIRQNRTPRDTPELLHELLDSYFEEKFGGKFRSNGTFAAFDKQFVKSFGKNIYAVFPIGNFKYLWSPQIDDMWLVLDRFFRVYYFDIVTDIDDVQTLEVTPEGQIFLNNSDFLDDADRFEDNFYKHMNEYTFKTTDLYEAIEKTGTGSEIMIIGDSYHAVKENLWEGTELNFSVQAILYDKFVGDR